MNKLEKQKERKKNRNIRIFGREKNASEESNEQSEKKREWKEIVDRK